MAISDQSAATFEMTDACWRSLGKSGDAHKYHYGHAVVVSGPSGQGGAARLAARGALRIGAGLVSVACRPDTVREHAAQLNAIMVKSFASETITHDALASVKPDAICIGPNLGFDKTSHRWLAAAMLSDCPICFDADAITQMSAQSAELPKRSNPQSVMTPHEGELRRFIPQAFDTTTCRVTLAQTAAAQAGCTVLFKGSENIIAAPDQRTAIVSAKAFHHAGWLATAGSGDVLAGFVTGLLARGISGFEAAAMAADVHLRCAEAFGPGLIAEDIPEMLPRVLAR